MRFRSVKIKFVIALSTTALYTAPQIAMANGAACVASAQTTTDKAVNDFGDIFGVEVSGDAMSSAIQNLEIKRTGLVDALPIVDANQQRAAENNKKAETALNRLLQHEGDPEAFQQAINGLSSMIRGSMNIAENQRLAASNLLNVKVSEMHSADQKEQKLEGDFKQLLEQFRQLSPEAPAAAKEQTHKDMFGWMPFIGKKVAKKTYQSANEMYEKLTTVGQAIDQAVAAVKAGGKEVQATVNSLKDDRVALINLMREYDKRTAMLIAIDHTFHTYMKENTKETDAIREFFTNEILKPVRQVLNDIESMKDSVNTALLMNFVLVQRGQELADRTDRMTERLGVDFFTSFSSQIAIEKLGRQTKILNQGELASANMKKQTAQNFHELGIEIRNEETVMDQVTTIIKDKNKIIEDELRDQEAYDQRITSKYAKIFAERHEENERMKAAALRMEKGERVRGNGIGDDASTLAAALRDSVTKRQAETKEVMDSAKVEKGS